MGTYAAVSRNYGGSSPSCDAEWFLDENYEPTAADHSPDVLYEIGKSPVVGRFMVAARDIEAGEVIFNDEPACIGPDNSSVPVCLGCYRKVNGSYRCPGCKWPLCSESCRRLASHAAECALMCFRRATVTVPWFDKPCAYYDAILPLRVLLLKMHNPKVYRLVALLMDHKEDLDDAAHRHRQKVVDFIRKTLKLAQDFTEEECHKVLGVLTVNSFVVHDSEEGNMDLIGLYPWTSLMSHHCSANTKITTREDFSYVCRATAAIKKGEEIVTSYHHYHYQLYGTDYRRNDLKSTWSFDCLCARCKDPTENGTLVSAVICDKCKFGNCLPKVSIDRASNWICDHCKGETPSATVAEKVKKFEIEIDEVKAGDADDYERLLRKFRYFLHENHYWVLDVKRRLIDIYGNKPGYELYKLPKETLERKIEFCEHLLSMAAKLCPGDSEMHGYLMFESIGARQRLAQWKWIRMRITTAQYIEELKRLEAGARTVVDVFGQIRLDSVEGQMGLKAREDVRRIAALWQQLSNQSTTSTVAVEAGRMSPSADSSSAASTVSSEDSSSGESDASRKRAEGVRSSICI